MYTQQNRYREAAEEFKEALRLDSTDDIARASLIKVLVILSEFSTALPLIQEYAQRKPHEFEALYLMGAVDRGLGNYADAEIMLEQAVQLDPKHYDVRYNLGFVLAKLGKLAAALENPRLIHVCFRNTFCERAMIWLAITRVSNSSS